MSYWWERNDDRIELATWLVGEGRLTTSGEALRFFEKPWHFDLEWDEYQIVKGSTEEELGLDDPARWAKL